MILQQTKNLTEESSSNELNNRSLAYPLFLRSFYLFVPVLIFDAGQLGGYSHPSPSDFIQ